jgi:glycosyltransferase involved in cell wall biosynthesis
MPTVSILIPAYRPDYLDLCIASALAQSYGDYELIISDDSGGDVIESVVSKWQDPRIRYVKNPNLQQPGANRDHLLSLATGKYAKFLFDDDLLMPGSVEVLVTAITQYQGGIAFHNRHFIDGKGKILHTPEFVPASQIALIPPEIYFEQLIGNAVNYMGEPTNVLIDLAALRSINNPFGINGGRMRFLTDVALFTNFATRGYTAVGVGYIGACFRQHDGQVSNIKQPQFAAGIYEWELLLRWSMQLGHLKPEQYANTMQNLHHGYMHHVNDFPELEYFLQLRGQPEADGGFMGSKYLAALSTAYMTLELKQIAARAARKT